MLIHTSLSNEVKQGHVTITEPPHRVEHQNSLTITDMNRKSRERWLTKKGRQGRKDKPNSIEGLQRRTKGPAEWAQKRGGGCRRERPRDKGRLTVLKWQQSWKSIGCLKLLARFCYIWDNFDHLFTLIQDLKLISSSIRKLKVIVLLTL